MRSRLHGAQLGWPVELIGELDHRRLKAPSVKLRSVRVGPRGDHVYCIDLRVRRPNAGEALPTATAHSLEHLLLFGLEHYLPQNFVAVGVMGCRTGFYLTLLNEGRAQLICVVLAQILDDLLRTRAVPYATVAQCGNYQDHDLEAARQVAREILARRDQWLDAA